LVGAAVGSFRASEKKEVVGWRCRWLFWRSLSEPGSAAEGHAFFSLAQRAQKEGDRWLALLWLFLRSLSEPGSAAEGHAFFALASLAQRAQKKEVVAAGSFCARDASLVPPQKDTLFSSLRSLKRRRLLVAAAAGSFCARAAGGAHSGM
jgi:hypothetical protein